MNQLAQRLEDWLTSYADNQATRSNILNNIRDGFWYSVMVGLTQSFLGVFALALGASDSMLGWLASLPALVALLSQIPAAVITERHPRRLSVIVPYGLVFRTGYLLFAFIPFLPITPVYRAWSFILLISIMNFPGTVSGAGWNAMMGDIFPSHMRGKVFGDRNMILGVATMLCTLAAGPILDDIVYPFNFVLLFVLSFMALMGSTWYLLKIIEHPATAQKRSPASGKLHGIRQALCDRSFILFTAALFIVHVGFNISAAMWTILYVKVLYLSKTYIGTLSVISQLTAVLTSRWWGRLADRKGNRWALFLSVLIFMPQPWLTIFVHTWWPLIPLQILSGWANAGFTMVLFNALLDSSPDESIRPSYIAVFNTLMGLTGFVAPMVGVVIYEATSMAVVFTLATLLRLVGMGVMAWKVGLRTSPEIAEA